MPMSKEEFVARHGEKYAPYYEEYDSDLKPKYNLRIIMEMAQPEDDSRGEIIYWLMILGIFAVLGAGIYFLATP